VYRIEHTIERDQTVLRSAISGIGRVKIDVKSPNEMTFLHALSPQVHNPGTFELLRIFSTIDPLEVLVLL
jgi:hypothetical protein